MLTDDQIQTASETTLRDPSFWGEWANAMAALPAATVFADSPSGRSWSRMAFPEKIAVISGIFVNGQSNLADLLRERIGYEAHARYAALASRYGNDTTLVSQWVVQAIDAGRLKDAIRRSRQPRSNVVKLPVRFRPAGQAASGGNAALVAIAACSGLAAAIYLIWNTSGGDRSEA